MKDDSGLAELFIPCPQGVKPEQIKEVQICPRNGTFYAVYVYKTQSFAADVDFNVALGETALFGGSPSAGDRDCPLGIDPGVSNWLACVSTDGKSFIIDGHKVKSLNQQYIR